jgi:anti-sigma-K factor RsiG
MSEHGGTRGETGSFDWESAEDLTALSEEELRDTLGGLVEEERAVSYRRELLRGRINLMRAELVRRGSVAPSPEELARVLLGEEGGP